MNFYDGSVEGIVNFDTRCATFTFYTFKLITSLYIVYNAQLEFLNRYPCSLHDFWTFLQRENFRYTGHATTSIDRGKTLIYDTFDRSAVKIHRRAFVSCSLVKACNFSGFVNVSSETFLEKLSRLNERRDRWGKLGRVRKHQSHQAAHLRWLATKIFFLANQKRTIQTLLELVQ